MTRPVRAAAAPSSQSARGTRARTTSTSRRSSARRSTHRDTAGEPAAAARSTSSRCASSSSRAPSSASCTRSRSPATSSATPPAATRWRPTCERGRRASLRVALVDAAMPALQGAEPRVRRNRHPGDALREPHRGDRHGGKPAPDSHGQHRRPNRPAARQFARQGGHRVSAGGSSRPARAQLRHPSVHRTHRSPTKSSSSASSSACDARGYSTDEEESVLEGCCFGAPILDAHGEAIAAISLRRRRCACATSSCRSGSSRLFGARRDARRPCAGELLPRDGSTH